MDEYQAKREVGEGSVVESLENSNGDGMDGWK